MNGCRLLAGVALLGLALAPSTGWADGALAYAPNGRAGISVNARGGREADAIALRYCGQEDCRIIGRFERTCVSIATGYRGGYGWVHRDRSEWADRGAIEECRRQGVDGCHVVVNGCDGR